MSGLVSLLVLAVCSVPFAQQHSAVRCPDCGDALARLRSKIDVERPLNVTEDAIIGHYSSTPDELKRRVSPLGGNDLYLFPDHTYFYYVWTDIPPATIRDKGTWTASANEITLKSDSDVRWNPGAERHYLLVRRRSHNHEILAIGMDRDLRYFEQNAKDDPEFMLLIVAKTRIKGIS